MSGLYNKVLAQHLGNFSVFEVVLEQLVPVRIRQLRKVFQIAFYVEVDPLRQIEFKS